MGNSIKLMLSALNDYIENKCSGKEVYFGIWSFDDIEFKIDNIPDNIQIEKGRNWLALRNGAKLVDGVLFPKILDDQGPEIVVMRGYLGEERIHSYSDPDKVRSYWSGNFQRRHNGIFSAVSITDDGKKLNLISDIFGIGALYYRQVGDLVFFSSASGLLSMCDDHPDYTSWVLNIVLGFIPGNETLTKEIKLLEPASHASFSVKGLSIQKWYAPNDFPDGSGNVNEEVLIQSHECLKRSVERCLKLHHGKNILPLSSGHDSRRIFGHLNDSELPFETCTLQISTATGEDIDLPYGERIAHDFNIDHTSIKLPNKQQWRINDIQRILSMDAQSQVHTWSVPLFEHYKNQSVTIYDGLGGDVFGFHGLVVNEVKNIKLPINVPKQFSCGLKTTDQEVTTIVENMKAKFKFGPNHGLLVFLHSISRKITSLWSQQQTKPGQLVVYPYLDLEYVEFMLSYSYKEKIYERTQLKIMEKYWPKLASYPSSREVPDDAVSLNHIYETNNRYSKEFLQTNCSSSHNGPVDFGRLLTLRARVILGLSRYYRKLDSSSGWWIRPVIEFVFWWKNRPLFFKITNEKK
ncbi:MAG: hypothetical protein H6912_07100 [Kordiimonadaceae bacterium]|nr:hypothetical protein [Kordiimonadaceae bacterium]